MEQNTEREVARGPPAASRRDEDLSGRTAKRRGRVSSRVGVLGSARRAPEGLCMADWGDEVQQRQM